MLCEGDGPCGTSDVVNNCQYQGEDLFVRPLDFYVRVACDTGVPALSPPPPSPPPVRR